MKWLAFVGAGLMAVSAHAKTVAWWHLDELEEGVKAKGGSPLFLNSVDPTKHAGMPRATPKINGNYQLDSAYEPMGVVAFPEGGVYYDYVQGGSHANLRGVRFNPYEAGTRATGSLIIVPNDPEIAPADFTFEFFVKIDDLSTSVKYQHIICERSATEVTGEGQDNGGFRFYWDHDQDKLGVDLYERWWTSEPKKKNTSILTAAGLDIENGRWHHVALTFDSATKKAKFYVDYRLIGSVELSSSNFGTATNDLILGQNGGSWGAFNGCMDELRISDSVLGPAEFLRVTNEADAPQMFAETVVYQRFCGYPDFFGPRASIFDELVLLNEAPQSMSFGEPAAISKYGAGYALTEDVPVQSVSTGYVGCASSLNNTAIALRSTEASRSVEGLPRACPCWNFSDVGATLPQGSFTAETYIRLTNVVKNTYVFYQGNAWSLSIDSENLSLNGTKVIATSELTDGIWHHLALVVDGSTHTGSVFMDYHRKISDVAMNSGVPEERFGIGCFGANCFITFYDVDFDDIRITKRKLSVDEFLHTKKAGVICDCSFDGTSMSVLGLTASGAIVKNAWTGLSRNNIDKPGSTIAEGLFGDQVTNQSAAVVSGGSGNGGAGYYTLAGDDIKLMTAKSFTFEFQAKLPSLDYTNYTGNAGYLVFHDSASGSAPVWNISFETPQAGSAAGMLGFKNVYKAFATINGEMAFDGAWHHFAFVYDKESHELRAYFDYDLKGTETGVTLPEESSSSLFFGSGKWGQTLGMHSWAFDNLRISAKALKPSEFKTSRHVSDGETLVWAPFDKNANLIESQGVAASFSGAATFGGRKAGVIVDAAGKAFVGRGANRGSLSLTTGNGSYSRLSQLEIADFSVEFFVRGAAAAAPGTDLVALKDKSGLNPVWSVRQGSDGNLHLMVTKKGDMIASDLGSFVAAGANWMHVALVFEPLPLGMTEVRCYADHQLVATKSFAELLAVEDLQGSSLGSDVFAGFVDEVRIVKGDLSVSDMLYADPTGLLLFVK